MLPRIDSSDDNGTTFDDDLIALGFEIHCEWEITVSGNEEDASREQRIENRFL